MYHTSLVNSNPHTVLRSSVYICSREWNNSNLRYEQKFSSKLMQVAVHDVVVHAVFHYASLSAQTVLLRGISCTIEMGCLKTIALTQGLWNDQTGRPSCFSTPFKKPVIIPLMIAGESWVKFRRVRKWCNLPWCQTDLQNGKQVESHLCNI